MEKKKPQNNAAELLEVVSTSGNIIRLAKRTELHSNPSLIHRVVHVLVFNKTGELLLQKRSLRKDIAPGKWDTSVGGHINPGEDISHAAKREMREELGISECRLTFLCKYLFSNHCESELVSTFTCVYDGVIKFNIEEIDEIRFWNLKEVKENFGKDIFSSHFEKEMKKILKMFNLNPSLLRPKDILLQLKIKSDTKSVINNPLCKNQRSQPAKTR